MLRALVLLAFVLTFPVPALADCSQGSCVPGGGDPALDCAGEYFGAGLRLNHPFPDPTDAGAPAPTEMRCFDGAAGCDLDGEVDGGCTFGVDVCLHNVDPNLAGCTPSQVTAVSATGVALDSSAVEQALADLSFPIDAPTCTDGATVRLELQNAAIPATRRLRTGSLGLSTSSTDGADDDDLTLTCLPRLWPSHGYNSFNHRATHTSAIRPANTAQLVEKWDFRISAAVSSTPAVTEDTVYTSSWNGRVYALDRETGAELWSFDTGATQADGALGVQSSITVLPDGRVVVGDSEANVYALDGSDGRLLWETTVGDPSVDHIWASPNVTNGRVFIGVASHNDQPCTQGRLVALDADTGAELWTTRTAPDRICEDDTTTDCTLDMDCPSGRCVGMCIADTNTPCQIDDDCGVDGPCGDAVGGGVTATPATDVTGETVYMVSVGCFTSPRVGNSDRMFRLDAADGNVVWALPDLPAEAFGEGPFQDYGFLNGPILVNDPTTPQLIAAGKDGFLRSLHPDTGAEVWTNDVGQVDGAFAGFGLFNGAPAYADGRLFTSLYQFADGGPEINHAQAWDASGGANAWEGSIDIEPTFGSVGYANGVVFIGSSDLFLETGSNAFYAFDASDGTLLQTFELETSASSGPAIVDDELFIGYGGFVEDGGVKAYELVSASAALTTDEQKCVDEINKQLLGSLKALTKEASGCVKARGKGKSSDALTDCVATDGKGKIAKARQKTVGADEKRCAAVEPAFGYPGDPAAVSDAAEAQMEEMLVAVFGSPDGLVEKSADKAGAGCQNEVTKRLSKLVAKLGSETNKAKKNALGGKKVAQVTSATELAAALTDDTVSMAVAGARSSFEKGVTNKCEGLDLAGLFPSSCGAGNPSSFDLAKCAIDCAEYHYCQALALADGLPMDCAAYAGEGCSQ
jgi:polyvinyl alcohol dehydrogenase (cytochrome)